jgi:hypothetical protein
MVLLGYVSDERRFAMRHESEASLLGVVFTPAGAMTGAPYRVVDGYKSVKDIVRVADLHATLLHALGLDHEALTNPHAGRPDSLTDVAVTKAEVVPELLV